MSILPDGVGRKFVAYVVVILSSTILLILDKLTGTEFSSLVGSLGIAFMGANVVSKFSNNRGNNSDFS